MPYSFDSTPGNLGYFAYEESFPWGDMTSYTHAGAPYTYIEKRVDPDASTAGIMRPEAVVSHILLEGAAILDFQINPGKVVAYEMVPQRGYTVWPGGLHRIRNIGDRPAVVVGVTEPRISATERVAGELEPFGHDESMTWDIAVTTPHTSKPAPAVTNSEYYERMAEGWDPYFLLESYSRVAVTPWGQERFSTFPGIPYAFSAMEIAAGAMLSLHSHDRRSETHVCFQGDVNLYEEVEPGRIVECKMMPKRGYTVEPGQFHSMKNVGDRPAIVIGTSGPRIDTTHRLADVYGRVGSTH